jgi:hypothetical protein
MQSLIRRLPSTTLASLRRTYVTPVRTWPPRTPSKPSLSQRANTTTTTGGAPIPDLADVPGPGVQFIEQEVGNGNGNGNGATEEGLGNGGLGDAVTDWSKSYFGLSTQAFSKEIADVLLAPVDPMDIEMKPGASFPPILVLASHYSNGSLGKMVSYISLKLNTVVPSIRLSVRGRGDSHRGVRPT